MNALESTHFQSFLEHLEARLNELKIEATQHNRKFGNYSQKSISPFSPIDESALLEEFEVSSKLDFVLEYALASSVNLLERLPWKVAMEARLCNHYSKIPGQIDIALKWLIEAHKDLAIIDQIRIRNEAEPGYKEPQKKASSISVEKAKTLFIEILQQHQSLSSRCTIISVVSEISDTFIKKLKPIDPESSLTEANLYESINSWRSRYEDFRKKMDQELKRLKADAKYKYTEK